MLNWYNGSMAKTFEPQKLSISKLRVNSGQIAGLPKNPRLIRDERFEKLKQSISELPSMLDIRELVCVPYDGTSVVVAGNMRLRAAKELGLKELPCKVLPADTPVAQLAEISVKDNVAFGADDFDTLANEWTDFPLEEWGVEISELTVGGDGDAIKQKELIGYEQVHVLLSFHPDVFADVEPVLSKIKSIEGVEYEQSAN